MIGFGECAAFAYRSYASNAHLFIFRVIAARFREAANDTAVSEIYTAHLGSERILFGTDTYAAGFQRGRIDYAPISERDKENILFNNAERLFRRFLIK